MSIIDTPFNTSDRLEQLKNEGVQTIIRYYNFSNSRKLPQKRLGLAEAQKISEAGLNVAAVFQQRQNQVADFTAEKGKRAGLKATSYALSNIEQPPGSAIYFSVDFDASKDDIKNNIIPYFHNIKKVFDDIEGQGLRIGCYGSGLVTSTLKKEGMIDLIWLTMSTGFRGSRDAIANKHYDLLQKPPATSLCGIGVDFNEANNTDFGAFRLDDEPVSEHTILSTPPPVIEKNTYSVIARSGLRLRQGPGTNFDTLSIMRAKQVVYVDSIVDGWARIDIDGDGLIDGFAYAAYLKKA